MNDQRLMKAWELKADIETLQARVNRLGDFIYLNKELTLTVSGDTVGYLSVRLQKEILSEMVEKLEKMRVEYATL